MDIGAFVLFVTIRFQWVIEDIVLLDEADQCYVMKVTLPSQRECGLVVNPLGHTIFPLNHELSMWVDNSIPW